MREEAGKAGGGWNNGFVCRVSAMRCDSMLQFVLHFFSSRPISSIDGGNLAPWKPGRKECVLFFSDFVSFLLAINRDRKFISSEREGVRNREFTIH